MNLPADCKLYYISDIQMRRLKLLKVTVVAEIANQEYMSDEEEARLRQEITEEETRFDHEQDIKTEEREQEEYDADIPNTIPDN